LSFDLSNKCFRVVNNGLPAPFSIHKASQEELWVENRIGATFGRVDCGVVGGVTRHEFSVLGAAVNLAARLMQSAINNRILVDGAVSAQADARFAFARCSLSRRKATTTLSQYWNLSWLILHFNFLEHSS
jgi:class 3 adenylate cyclase